MATPVTPGSSASAEASLSSVFSAARAALSAEVAATEGGGSPAEVPPAVASPAVPVPPVAPVAAPTTPAAPPPAVAAPTSPAPAVPAPAAVAPATPAPVVAPTPDVPTREQIDTWLSKEVERNVAADQTLQGWSSEWRENGKRLEALGADLRNRGTGEIATLEQTLFEIKGVIDGSGDDEFRKSEATSRKAQVETELRIKRLERAELTTTNRDLSRQFDEREAAYIARANGKVSQYLDNLGLDDRLKAHASEFQAVWDPAIIRVAKAAGIPDVSLPRFTKIAKMECGIQIDQSGRAMQDHEIEPFLAGVATEYVAMVDEHHRAKSQDYGRTAADRAAQPAPSTIPAGGSPVAASPNPSPSSNEDILKAVYRDTPRLLAEARR